MATEAATEVVEQVHSSNSNDDIRVKFPFDLNAEVDDEVDSISCTEEARPKVGETIPTLPSTHSEVTLPQDVLPTDMDNEDRASVVEGGTPTSETRFSSIKTIIWHHTQLYIFKTMMLCL